MRFVIVASLLVAAVIHLLPVSGVLGPERLTALYGIAFTDPDLLILMRHRAVLFGILGVFLAAAAFVPKWRTPAFCAGLVSLVSFLALAWSGGNYNAEIGRVVLVDIVALVCVVIGGALHAYRQGRQDRSAGVR